ncbi:hypothetical protein [Streptomyces purpurogeneiscleroticus]|uniref:hypothetical protein n=1 Tax=Streptomyces purpurogeneiscleroticus TaxID=68259 RepID=UPI001CC1396E|nr:hypothetical protein [Streptomyces purpurogeneiscleroticus]MBZ4018215.1 hypothetical protein [Streptomyces purpurogeneiscleroticus]
MGEERTDRDPREADMAPAQKREPAKDERDRSAEEVNADRPSVRGEKPRPAPKRASKPGERRAPEES